MNQEEEQDKLLFDSLGVTSANVEDVERHILSKANEESRQGTASDDSSHRRGEEGDESSRMGSNLLNKLHAIELEIEAVSSGINADASTSEEEAEEGKTGNNLQKALATDRLKNLRRAKAQIEKELSELGVNTSKRENKLLKELVEERPKKRKGILKNEGESSGSKRRFKTVSYDDDADFDAVLDASRTGFMETEREELVRKGLLTPFHSLKGFEKRVQSTEPQSNSANNTFESEIVAKVRKSMLESRQARPTTKLMDSASLPSLEPPTAPFQRLRRPLEIHASDGEDRRNKKRRSKERRPLPAKKWREKLSDGTDIDEENEDEDEDEESEPTVTSEPDISLEGGLRIPSRIYNNLFEYQKVGVQWLWELHCQKVGGIIGDEMGLGKTVQVISFLASLHNSNLYKPSIVVCPVTLLKQWEREIKTWYPRFKVEILHDSAHNFTARTSPSDSGGSEESDGEDRKATARARKSVKWDEIVSRVTDSESGLLLTTYEQIRVHCDKLLDVQWGYAVLDEGHKIRNPNAEITLMCKELQTRHRIIMTGAPIQNKLAELWSLFDFVFPGKLGVYPVFEAEFSVPITTGGYATATPLQVSTAYRCVVALRDIIMPYLLRRMKADVNAQLPKKTEHVLFCSLTKEQRSAYRAFLASSDVEQIFEGSRRSLYGIDIMRKICNHPDLLEREFSANNPDYGNPIRSGKMQVLDQVLKVWKEQRHRVLIFAQTQQMLDILEKYVKSKEYVYRRMDGYTPVKQRMALMDEFNNSSEVFVFILTTKVGGLGTNLTGANRVIIYDPDWNPSTDIQARERAWRIGQTRDVTVYRLITRGTIEEKVYQRQIYKNFLTHKVLKNPCQKRFFKAKDMRDLFTLQDEGESTETSNIFAQLSEEINVRAEAETSAEKDDKGKEKEKVPEEGNDGGEKDGDILKSLMDAHGIHSAVNHDAIINASEDEKLRIEERASKIAQRAAEALRDSQLLRSRESFSVPTWTGSAGSAGASSSHKRFGSTLNSRVITTTTTISSSPSITAGIGSANGRALSSSELLNRIRGTHTSAASDALERDLEARRGRIGNGNGNGNVVSQPEVLVRLICSFLKERGGSADSVSIIDYFERRVRYEDKVLFKSLLKEIASLEKRPNGSRWVLKPEYRQQ